jgi:hypothetical protein
MTEFEHKRQPGTAKSGRAALAATTAGNAAE